MGRSSPLWGIAGLMGLVKVTDHLIIGVVAIVQATTVMAVDVWSL